jgi:hypothetical protein
MAIIHLQCVSRRVHYPGSIRNLCIARILVIDNFIWITKYRVQGNFVEKCDNILRDTTKLIIFSGFHNWTIGQRTCIGGLNAAYFVAIKCNNSTDIMVVSGKWFW